MKIIVEDYDNTWPDQFLKLKIEILNLLKGYNPRIEHFGSTAVPGLPAKPVIDILVGINDILYFPDIENLLLLHKSYIHYKVFDEETPDRRLFVRVKDSINSDQFDRVMNDMESIPHDRINTARIAHVHIWEYNSSDWERHIAFRDYLIAHDDTKKEYGTLKKGLGKKEWSHGMEYNDKKNAFIKDVEAKAIKWYRKQR